MRSVVVHLSKASKVEIVNLLTKTYSVQQGDNWQLEIEGDAYLYIYLLPNAEAEQISNLGYIPTISIAADVSGRHKGDAQVRSFVSALLSQFDGHVQDDYSNHCWTLEEIHSNKLVNGHKFFDYQGYYRPKV